jgi:hypothetical protein
VEAQPGALPLLEHGLFLLWVRRAGDRLTFDAYRSIGGVQGAIAQHAERIYAGFDDEQKEIARRILLRLTKPGHGTEDTRQQTMIDDLVTHEHKRQAVEAVVTVS